MGDGRCRLSVGCHVIGGCNHFLFYYKEPGNNLPPSNWRYTVKYKFVMALVLAAGGLLAASSISAHHGVSGYDMEKVITVTGTVTSFNWANPHCMVHIDVKDGNGAVKDWIIELAAPTIMTRFGWAKDSLKPGDTLSAETHPARNGATTGLSGYASEVLKFVANGRELPSHAGPMAPN